MLVGKLGSCWSGPSSGERRCLVPCLSPFPALPVVIPDSGISPIQLGTVAIPEEACPQVTRAQAMARIRASHSGLLPGSSCTGRTEIFQGLSAWLPGPCMTATTQGSFAREALPSVIAPTSPCAGPEASHPLFEHGSYRRRPCCLRHPQTGPRDRPALSCSSFLECHVPYAGGSSSAHDQFFLDDIGLRLSTPGSAFREVPTNGFQWAGSFDTADIP